jgi:predicted CXXCH cytochrome family protein
MNRLIRFVVVGAALLVPTLLLAQTAAECERCHADPALKTVRYGAEVPLTVTHADLEGSPHEGMECIECHEDLKGKGFPHAKRLVLPDCGGCHDDIQQRFVEGFFNPLRAKGFTSIPHCSDCHGKHKVRAKGNPKQFCGLCHQDVMDDFTGSAHWDEASADDPAVTCVSCHDPHYKMERSTMPAAEWRVRTTEKCRACHAENVATYDASRHFAQVKAGNPNAPVCYDCHSRHKILSPRDPKSKVSVAKLDQLCMKCHQGYDASIHRPEHGDDPRLETCVVCHTGHSTTPGQSAVLKEEVARTCLRCHREGLPIAESDAHGALHRKELESVDAGQGAHCGKCHDYHFRAPGKELKTSLRDTCADCHPRQQLAYRKSHHYIARQKGHLEAPDCAGCHLDRHISKVGEYFTGQNIVKLCGSCHGDRDMMLKFQLNDGVVKGYNTSYHGQMYALGFQGEKFATCVSCHDNHSILPADDPESTVSRQNILNTCGKCHKDVNENFVGYLSHYSPMAKKSNPILGLIHMFMVWLLGGTLFVFGGHTLLWLMRLLIQRRRVGSLKAVSPPGKPTRVLRFQKPERVMHLVMVLSFLTLASTGLPLKYSQTTMATWFVQYVFGFGTAALLHRIAGFTLFTVFFLHVARVVYRLAIKKEKGLFSPAKSLVPNGQDAKDFVEHMKYFVGLRPHAPAFGRWTYWEKFDYFAVFWGVLVIGASGLTLMFPGFFTRLLPGWLINAAHIIHSEEALLATAFIFTVHFFNTHLRPGVFPMDEVIFTGRMTEEHFLHERARERAQLTDDEWKALQVPPLPKRKRRLYYVAGFFFLGVGFVLLTLIVVGTFA